MGVVTSDLGLRCVGAMADPVTPRIHPAICGMFLACTCSVGGTQAIMVSSFKL